MYRYHGIRGKKIFITAILSTMSIALLALLVMPHLSIHAASQQKHVKPFDTTGNWSRYMYSDLHQGNNSGETILNTTNAHSLNLKWTFPVGSALIAEPLIVSGIIYEGANDGYMYAINATTHQQVWRTFLGIHSMSTCPTTYGITGTAAVEGGLVFVGEGYTFYALNVLTGSIVWQTNLAINTNLADNVIWSAPAVANGNVYIGLASDCDKPLIQGVLYELSETTGSVVAEAKMVPDTSVGGGIWTAPTIDAVTGTVIVSTGSVEKVPPVLNYTASIVELDWNTLAVKQSWQVPAAQRIKDADWGATPTLFPGPNGTTYIGCINKNSIYYVFDEANLNAGPVWEQQLGVGGALAGRDASFASSPYVNGVLFIATALTTITGTSYTSSIGAFNALTGQQVWRLGLPGRIYPSPITANGLLFDQENKTLEVRDQSNGNLLYSYTVPANGLKGSVTVLNGMVYLPAVNGKLYVFGL